MPSEHDAACYRPCVVLAHADASYAAQTARRLRQLGWDVHRAGAGAEVRRLARLLDPQVIVLDIDLLEESGWLTCAKLTGERPGSKVVLVGEPNDRNREMAHFVGACALVRRDDGLAAVVAQGTPPRAAAG
jgi:DNA-binding response OmpR family regulator